MPGIFSTVSARCSHRFFRRSDKGSSAGEACAGARFQAARWDRPAGGFRRPAGGGRRGVGPGVRPTAQFACRNIGVGAGDGGDVEQARGGGERRGRRRTRPHSGRRKRDENRTTLRASPQLIDPRRRNADGLVGGPVDSRRRTPAVFAHGQGAGFGPAQNEISVMIERRADIVFGDGPDERAGGKSFREIGADRRTAGRKQRRGGATSGRRRRRRTVSPRPAQGRDVRFAWIFPFDSQPGRYNLHPALLPGRGGTTKARPV